MLNIALTNDVWHSNHDVSKYNVPVDNVMLVALPVVPEHYGSITCNAFGCMAVAKSLSLFIYCIYEQICCR